MTPTPKAIENAARAGEPCPGLKPCPFCGEKKIYFNLPDQETGFRGSLNCPACLASMPNETNNVEELIECWNHREPAGLGDMVLVPRDWAELVIKLLADTFGEDDTAVISARAMIAATEGERCK